VVDIHLGLPFICISIKMGCGAAVARPTANTKKSSTPANQRKKVQIQAPEGSICLYFFILFLSLKL
jgi:hypothetical protein